MFLHSILYLFYAEHRAEEMAFNISKVSVAFILFAIANLAVYCTAEGNETAEQRWYYKVCICHMRRRLSQNKNSIRLIERLAC